MIEPFAVPSAQILIGLKMIRTVYEKTATPHFFASLIPSTNASTDIIFCPVQWYGYIIPVKST